MKDRRETKYDSSGSIFRMVNEICEFSYCLLELFLIHFRLNSLVKVFDPPALHPISRKIRFSKKFKIDQMKLTTQCLEYILIHFQFNHEITFPLDCKVVCTANFAAWKLQVYQKLVHAKYFLQIVEWIEDEVWPKLAKFNFEHNFYH